MSNYGPNTDEVERFIGDIEALTADELVQLGKAWRMLAVPIALGPPDVNLHVATAIAAARDVMPLRKLLHELNPTAESALPVPSDDQLHLAVRAGAVGRDAVSNLTADQDAREAVAGMAGVLALRPWIPEPLVENVLAPFLAIRPGWLEQGD